MEYLIAITIGLVEIVKKTGRISDDYLPVIGLAIGLVLGYFNGLAWMPSLLVGLGASGTFKLVQPVGDAIVEKVRG